MSLIKPIVITYNKLIRTLLRQKLFVSFFLVSYFTFSYIVLQAQSVPEVPYEIKFAGVSIQLPQSGRSQIQQEVQRLYAHPKTIQTEINSLQQLTPFVKPLLTKANLPDDFRFMALPFSDIDTLGFWALSPAKAQSLHLQMTIAIDERFHPLASTETVVNDLSRLQLTQRNYVLTLLRYLQPTMQSAVSERTDPAHILLSPQSPPLLWKILARKVVIEREELTYHPAVKYILYKYPASAGQTLLAIAQRLHVAEERTKSFNQWLKTDIIPTGKEYPVLVQVTPDEFSTIESSTEPQPEPETDNPRPISTGFPVLAKSNTRADGLRSTAIFYTINDRRGIQAQNCDNFITLAYYGNISIDDFLKFNELSERQAIIQPGEIYYLERKAKRAKIPYHVVQKNQTLHEVAKMYGVRLKSLLKFNRITATQRVQPGRLLWLQRKRPTYQPIEYIKSPAREPKTAPPQEPIIVKPAVLTLTTPTPITPVVDTVKFDLPQVASDTLSELDTVQNEVPEKYKLHSVAPGQTYYAIAHLYGVTVRQLYTWNNLSERIPLEIGQQLIVDVSRNRPVEPARPKLSKPVVVRKPEPAKPRPVQAAPPQKEPLYHTVQPGQTVYRVALINKVSVENLMRWNNLTNYVIEVGQKLLIRK